MAVESADVLLDQVDARRGDVKLRIVGEAQRQILLGPAILADRLHAGEAGDAMGVVSGRVEGDLQRFKEFIESLAGLDPSRLRGKRVAFVIGGSVSAAAA